MSSLPYPYNFHQLKTILKNADHFKHKVPHFDIIIKPLHQLLQSDNFVWNDHYQCLYAYIYRFSPFHYINSAGVEGAILNLDSLSAKGLCRLI